MFLEEFELPIDRLLLLKYFDLSIFSLRVRGEGRAGDFAAYFVFEIIFLLKERIVFEF